MSRRCSGWAALLGFFIAFAAHADEVDGETRIYFDPWSNRLAADQGRILDQCAAAWLKRGWTTALIVVPSTVDVGVRRFIDSRAVVIEHELDRRGILGERRRGGFFDSAASADANFIVLRIADHAPPREHEASASGLAMAPIALTATAAEPRTADPRSGERSEAAAAAGPPRWHAAPGMTLRGVLQEWSGRAGWTVVWRSERDYPIEANAELTGDFVTVMGPLLEGFATAVPAPLGHLYKENRVLVVVPGEEK